MASFRFKNAWFISRKDIQYALRERETILWLFVMPLVFFFFLGQVTSGFSGSSNKDAKTPISVLMPKDQGFLAARVTQRLEDSGFVVKPVKDKSELGKARRRLTIPTGFTKKAMAGEEQVILYSQKSSGLTGDYDTLRVQKAVYTVLADMIAAKSANDSQGGEVTAAAFEALDAIERKLTIQVAPAGKRKVIPSGYQQTIPGTMVMFTLLILLTSGSVLLVIERRQGLLRRLASTPMTRSEVVLGKWFGKLALGIVQIAFSVLAGSLLFGIEWGPHYGSVFALLILWGAFCASAGLLLGNLARSEGQAVALGVITSMLLGALGGCWWPIEILPQSMQDFASLLPTNWAISGLHKLITFGSDPSTVLSRMLILATGTALLGYLGIKSFRYQD